MISEISRDQVDSVLYFTARLLREKYTKSDSRKELFEGAKLKIDTVALDDITTKFETILNASNSEAEWGKFLQKNLFLIDSRYVDVVAELNFVLAKSRKVDFGMIDTHGFLGIFEIKKPETRLLSKETDRGKIIGQLMQKKRLHKLKNTFGKLNERQALFQKI